MAKFTLVIRKVGSALWGYTKYFHFFGQMSAFKDCFLTHFSSVFFSPGLFLLRVRVGILHNSPTGSLRAGTYLNCVVPSKVWHKLGSLNT